MQWSEKRPKNIDANIKQAGRWTTVDSLWPREPGFTYVGCRNAALADPSGKIPPCCWTGSKPTVSNYSELTRYMPSKCLKYRNGNPITGRVGDYFEVDVTITPTLTAISYGTPELVSWECFNQQLTSTSENSTWVEFKVADTICNDTWSDQTPCCSKDISGTVGDETAMLYENVARLGQDFKSTEGVRDLCLYIAFVPHSSCPHSTQIEPLKLFQQITYDPSTGVAHGSLFDYWPPGYPPIQCQTPPNGWPL